MRFSTICMLGLTGCGLLVTMGDPDPVGAERPEARMATASPAFKPKAPKRPALALLTARPPLAADTLVMVVAVTWGPDDNKGPTDSAVVRVLNWQGPVEQKFVGAGPYPASTTLRAPIDYGQGTGGTATYNLKACAGVWRYGLYAETCSAEVPWNVTYPPPPAPGSVNLTVTKVP